MSVCNESLAIFTTFLFILILSYFCVGNIHDLYTGLHSFQKYMLIASVVLVLVLYIEIIAISHQI